MIRIQRIYEEIIEENGWSENHDSKERNFRNKFSFLMIDVMLRDPESYKSHGANEVPKQEAPIIKNLIVASLNRKSTIGKWFNRNLDLSVSENAIQLFSEVKHLIDSVYKDGLTDKVTKNEWLAAIDAAIDYSSAHKVIEIKQLLEDLRATAKPLNHTISFGDIIGEYDDGSREYLHRGKRNVVQITDKTTIGSLIDNLSVEKEYHDVLISLITKFKDHASSKAFEIIRDYARIKSLNDDGDDGENIARNYGSNSDYLHRYRNIYEFLKSNPETVAEIENEVGTIGLLEFFNISLNGEKK